METETCECCGKVVSRDEVFITSFGGWICFDCVNK